MVRTLQHQSLWIVNSWQSVTQSFGPNGMARACRVAKNWQYCWIKEKTNGKESICWYEIKCKQLNFKEKITFCTGKANDIGKCLPIQSACLPISRAAREKYIML